MQLLTAFAFMALATATSAASTGNLESSSRQREIFIPHNQNGAMVPLDWSYPPLAELGMRSDQADRINSAMARFMAANGDGGPRFGSTLMIQPEIRLRTRSAPNAPESSVFDELLNTLEANHGKEQRSIYQQQQQQQQQATSSGSLKSLRNIQPVFMRLPPRFGKRSMI